MTPALSNSDFKLIRNGLGLTQRELAGILGMSIAAIKGYEAATTATKHHPVPKVVSLALLAVVYLADEMGLCS